MPSDPKLWLLGIAAALLVGFSKTGMPGVGLLTVPLMAMIYQGELSVGSLLPMLIFADFFAVYWYRKDTRWDKLFALLPWVFVGFVGGAALLWWLGEARIPKGMINQMIGALVLLMLAIHLIRMKYSSRMEVHSPVTAAGTGAAAGFSTTISNAAGPIMSIYLTGLGLPKAEFMGTTAWYFLILNSTKLPLYIGLTYMHPKSPFFSAQALLFDLCLLPVILLGVYIGKRLLPKIPQKSFDALVLILAAAAAIKLLIPA